QVDLHAVDTLPMNIGGLTDLDPGGVEGLVIKVGRADGKKCERCWNYRPAVGTIAEHPTLCDRCVEAIR
ncbi:MAG TPA: zinc finger domain-containing protein, partial [Nitrospiraceae bacterium]|nr:zinc finger domain-containing protein [Nitrospiraceae bacterium]